MTTATPVVAERERQAACEATFNRISKRWPGHGDLRTLKRDYPALNEALEASEKALNDTWKACRDDMATMKEFTAALSAWEAMNYQVVAVLKAVK